jgi:hypothetical protein
MRTYGRVWGAISSSDGLGIVASNGLAIFPSDSIGGGQQAPFGTPSAVWIEIDTDANGSNDMVWLTTLCQCLLLNLNEDPFFANYGIPAIPSAQSGVPPDFYVSRMQRAFAPYFASLTITRVSSIVSKKATYQVKVTTHQGVKLNASVPIPF